MDPVMKMWMFNSWLEDTNENVELFKHHGYLIGSFINPEAVNHATGGNSYSVSEQEFEDTTKMVREAIIEQTTVKKSRKRRRKKTN